ncbi:MAG: hypothetical protein CSB55_08285 [Candidatus Cloacimonadota bacterium]|nr:MAG: hypothetical protein CSB55_08285 [Candidatus Cloacimonadota bacterium]
MPKKKQDEYFHAIKIIPENCSGCAKCVRDCPTEALRVIKGIITLDDKKCIDCGKCLEVCKYGALMPVVDKLESICKFSYKAAIVSSCFAGQFSEYSGYGRVMKILRSFGFDEIADESEVTEIQSLIIRDYIKKHPNKRPVISGNCPAAVRLIQLKFPSLTENILHLESALSTLTEYYRDKISEEQNKAKEEIGIFLIVPCIAHVTAVHQPEGSNRRFQEGALSIKEIGNKVLFKIDTEHFDCEPADDFMPGRSWAVTGAEACDVGKNDLKTLSVNGIENITEILHKIEDRQIEQFDYVVLHSCNNGCVGGVLNIENPFVAARRIENYPIEEKRSSLDKEYFWELYRKGRFDVLPLEPRPIMELDSDIKEAIKKMKAVKKIRSLLPGLDCCACGSPSCSALAEDIVCGNASLEDCLILLREKNA